jgi:hypothetical protein
MTHLGNALARKIHNQQAVDLATTGSIPLNYQSLSHAGPDIAEGGMGETYSSSKF